MVKRLRLTYIIVAAVAVGVFLCRNTNVGVFLCRRQTIKEKYVNVHMRKILNDIKMKEREGQSI